MHISAPPAEARTLQQTVQVACLREQYAKSPLPTFGVCFVAALCAVPGWIYLPHDVVIAYLCSMFGYQAVMLSLSQWVYRQRRIGLSLAQVSTLAVLIYIANGVAVGASSVVLYRYGGQPMFLFVVLVQLGLASGSLGTSAYHPPTILAYLLPAKLIFVVDLLVRQPDFTVTVVAVGLIFNLVYVIVMGLQQSASIRSSFRLRFENESLVVSLQEEKQRADSARQEAEIASAERSRFFANASHDLRQPVHALNIYVSLLHSTESDTERSELMKRISTCVDTLSDLFSALLTVSRSEDGGEYAFSSVPVPLQAVLDSVAAQYQPLAQDKGLLLNVVTTSLWVLGDRTALERMVANLTSNAIRFTPHGRISIGVRRRAHDAEVQVLDTGIGIERNLQDQIFAEFYQVNNPGRHADRGFGLGLVIVRRLASALGYEVKLRSQPGRGTCFAIRIPSIVSPPVHEALSLQADTVAPFDSQVRLLVVDDDPLIRDALSKLFAEWGVVADSCGTSKEAYMAARERGKGWDCLLLDQRLDEPTTGVMLARELRALLHRDIPVALLTGENDGAWTLEAQAEGYTVLHKPVKMIRLRAFIAASVSGSPKRQPKR